MKKNQFWENYLFIFFFLALMFSFSNATVVYANKSAEGSGTKNQMDPETQAMMSKWMEFSTPGENHKVLNVLAGDWDYVVKWWMAPGGNPEISKGRNKNNWIMGGRYLQLMSNGTSLGQPFEGMGLVGFDNSLKKYQSIWIDNMGTGIMKAESTYDPAKKLFTEHGRFSDPLFGELSFRGEIKIIDNEHYSYKMYTVQKSGQEFQSLEVLYTRKK